MKVIDTKNAPGAIGPYSQAFEVARSRWIRRTGPFPTESPHRRNRAAKMSARSWRLPEVPWIMS